MLQRVPLNAAIVVVLIKHCRSALVAIANMSLIVTVAGTVGSKVG